MIDAEQNTQYAVTLAALLHDIGKFAERAGMEVSRQYSTDNAGLYQKYNSEQKRHTHQHALYSAAFIERYADLLPAVDEPGAAKSGNSLINLAAMHHKPETPLQAIVTEADRLSSGIDRQVFEGDEQGIAIKHFRRTRLIPIAEEMLRGEEFHHGATNDSYLFRYPLTELSPNRIFPLKRTETEPLDDTTARAEYATLFQRFLEALALLEQRDQPALWLEHFDSLYQQFTSCIPAATVGKVIPDVSLYDHSRATAALATALCRFHTATRSLNEQAIHDRKQDKYLLVSGDFYGIQSFIFCEGGSSNKAAAKLLRGRSFAVSLLSELSADLLCRDLGLPVTSILLNAAGKFTVLAANLPESRETVQRVEERINNWLIERYFGEVTIGFSTVEASGDDFDMQSGRFAQLWSKLGRCSDARKYRKFDLERHAGVVAGFLDSIDNRYRLCPFCGKRAGNPETRNDELLKQLLGDHGAACFTCRDHIYLGNRLVKSDRLAVLKQGKGKPGGKLKEPLFGDYQLVFDPTSAALETSLKQGNVLRYWYVGRIGEQMPVGVTVRFISGYIPTYTQGDQDDLYRLLHGEKSAQKKDELYGMIAEGGAKSFHHIAKMALVSHPETEEKFTGSEALGFLKADVDNLGNLFACGLPENRLNLSRLATFSRQMNSFFSLYLPYRFAHEQRYQDMYTVFAGGDDLFLVGPWNRTIDFAAELHREFSRFACDNKKITLSAGISVNKPGIPVPNQAEHAETALERAKSSGKNSLTLFGETVTWKEFSRLLEIRDTLTAWQKQGYIGKALLYRLNEFIEMAKREKNLRASGRPIGMEEMGCLKWRSLFTYSATRNVGKNLSKEERSQALGEVMGIPAWLNDHAGTLKIALWQILYNQR